MCSLPVIHFVLFMTSRGCVGGVYLVPLFLSVHHPQPTRPHIRVFSFSIHPQRVSAVFCSVAVCYLRVVSLRVFAGEAVRDETGQKDKVEPNKSATARVIKTAVIAGQRAVKAAPRKGSGSVRSKRRVSGEGKPTHVPCRLFYCWLNSMHTANK